VCARARAGTSGEGQQRQFSLRVRERRCSRGMLQGTCAKRVTARDQGCCFCVYGGVDAIRGAVCAPRAVGL